MTRQDTLFPSYPLCKVDLDLPTVLGILLDQFKGIQLWEDDINYQFDIILVIGGGCTVVLKCTEWIGLDW